MRKRILSSGWMFVKTDSILNILVCWTVFKRGQVARAWTANTRVEVSFRAAGLESADLGNAMRKKRECFVLTIV